MSEINILSQDDIMTIGRCLHAAVDGPFFPDWEFGTLFGLERDEVAAIAKLWPDVDVKDPDVDTAVRNTLNNLIGYPHCQAVELARRVGTSEADMQELLQRWNHRRSLG